VCTNRRRQSSHKKIISSTHCYPTIVCRLNEKTRLQASDVGS
jgi:hypothetical protein